MDYIFNLNYQPSVLNVKDVQIEITENRIDFEEEFYFVLAPFRNEISYVLDFSETIGFLKFETDSKPQNYVR